MSSNPPDLCIVVPCYNEEEVLGESSSRFVALLERLMEAGAIGPSSHVLFVDDGSRDKTWSLIEDLSASSPRIRGLKLSRNRGHQNAVLAGLLETKRRPRYIVDRWAQVGDAASPE